MHYGIWLGLQTLQIKNPGLLSPKTHLLKILDTATALSHVHYLVEHRTAWAVNIMHKASDPGFPTRIFIVDVVGIGTGDDFESLLEFYYHEGFARGMLIVVVKLRGGNMIVERDKLGCFGVGNQR